VRVERSIFDAVEARNIEPDLLGHRPKGGWWRSKSEILQ
jgi:hypothetical protein